MLKTDLYNQKGERIGEVELPENVFGAKINGDLIHQAFVAQNANKRVAIAHTKDRAQVRGGGKKPWKQKGTGRARHGSTRSPIWVGGGVTGGPTKERVFSKKINKTMKRNSLFALLASKLKEGNLFIVDRLEISEPKTKLAAAALKNFFLKAKEINLGEKKGRKDLLVAVPAKNENLRKASANISYLKYTVSDSLNVGDMLTYKYLLLPKDSIGIIVKTYKKA